MSIRPLTRFAVHSLARATPWVESELLGLRHVVAPGATCVDVGAALGLYTAELARIVGADGVVHSVEPLRFAHSVPSRALGLRTAGNVVRHSLALADVTGKRTMSIPIRNDRLVTGRAFVTAGASGLGSNSEFDDQLEVVVEVDTLDRLRHRWNLGRVDFVKADVEGAELAVLHGARELVEQCGPRLLLEIEDRHLSRFGRRSNAIVRWLTERGYRMYAWHGRTWQPVDEVIRERRNYLFSLDDPGRA